MGFPGGTDDKEPACQGRRCKRRGFDPWVRKIPWRRVRQPTPVFLPQEFYGQRNLAGCSPWGLKELNTTEQLSTYLVIPFFESLKNPSVSFYFNVSYFLLIEICFPDFKSISQEVSIIVTDLILTLYGHEIIDRKLHFDNKHVVVV